MASASLQFNVVHWPGASSAIARLHASYGQDMPLLSERGGIMTRSQLEAMLLEENPGLHANEVGKVVDLFFRSIEQTLAAGGRVELRGFGVFTTRTRDGRVGRNPSNGVKVEIPTKRAIHFKAGTKISSRIRRK